MRLYDYPLSGNGYKVRLLLSHLGLPYDYVPIDILAGQSRAQPFLEKNPAGKVPVLEYDSGETLPESNAILFALAQGTPYWPNDRLTQAQVMRWLFFEQRELMPHVGGARYWLSIQEAKLTQANAEMVEGMQAKGTKALQILDRCLRDQDFVAGDYSIADISLYAYSHLANEAGIPLSSFEALPNWIARVQRQPGYLAMDQWPPDKRVQRTRNG